jgi:hypothetical protein
MRLGIFLEFAVGFCLAGAPVGAEAATQFARRVNP